MKYIYLFILLILFNVYECFFQQNSKLNLNGIKNRRNLTCTSDFDDLSSFTNCEYCVYEFFTNGTDFVISHDCIYLTNTYRLVTKRCTGFNNQTDIGYGLCSKLSFEYLDVDLLCICATDSCNENFTTCKQSVDSTGYLPALPTISPTPSLFISCNDTPIGLLNSTYYCIRDSTPYINMTQCEEYVKTHTVLCMYLESDDGQFLNLIAIPDEDYEYVLADQIQTMQTMAMKTNVKQYYNETTGSFYVQWKERNENNYTTIYNRCYCLTNNCNSNLTTCLQANRNTNKKDKNQCNILLLIMINIIIMSRFFSFKTNLFTCL